jgi:hypothetical protein
VSLVDRTRELVTRQLGIAIRARELEPYRQASGKQLEGEWLGGFAQAGIVLNKATAVSARFDERAGAMVDEYGESTVYVMRRNDDQVWLTKQYATQHFTYVGRLGDGTLAGYWYSPLRPEFSGVFWLARADRLDEATLAAFRARVRSTSPRRVLALVGLPIITLAPLLAYPHPAGLLGTMALNIATIAILRTRMRSLQREVALWRQELE